jgi:hypothetical protein
MLKHDQYIVGLLIGILTPITLFGIILLMNYILLLMGVAKFYLDLQSHVLISLAGNLLPIRYYFVNLKMDKTGRGVLLITFVLILTFFALQDVLFIKL